MKRLMETPKVILLQELPDSGKSFDYTSDSGELNDSLKDAVGENAYKVNLFVERIGNAWQATGKILSTQDLECSRCGTDLKSSVDLDVREIIMVHPEMPRSGKTAKVNHSTDLDPLAPDCLILHKPELNVGEFVRELVVLNEPFKPLCKKPCENPYLASQAQAQGPPDDSKSPFSVLKDFKLNS